MSIPRDFIDLLLVKTDIVELINARIPLRRKSAANYFACCPFHQENTPSFSVSQPKQFYYCFGCGAHGNVIDFLMQQDRLNFVEAIELLARQAGMEIPEHARPKDSLLPLYEMMTKVVTYYEQQLKSSKRAIHYLKGRGITGETAKTFKLGYALPSWQSLVNYLGKSADAISKLEENGLILKNKDKKYFDRFRDRIIFPIQDTRGRIIALGGRVIGEEEPKYLNSPETLLFHKGKEIYGLYHLLKNRHIDKVLIVEGYMDVLSLYQQGIDYAVATLGTATTAKQIQMLSRYSTHLVFCYDGDRAGRVAAWRALQMILPLMQDEWQVYFLFLPDQEDPDSLIRKEGKALFENRIAEALPLSNFLLNTLSERCSMHTLEGRAEFAARALKYVQSLRHHVFLQEVLLEAISKRARMDIHRLKSSLAATEPGKKRIPAKENDNMGLPLSLQLIVSLLVQYPYLAKYIKKPLSDDVIRDYPFFQEIINIIKSQPHLKTGGLLEHFRGKEEQKIIAKLAKKEHLIPEEGLEKEFKGALHRWAILSYDNKINDLLSKAAKDSLNATEKEALNCLIKEKKQLSLIE